MTELNNKLFPINAKYLKNYLSSCEVDLESISIRELNKLVDDLSNKFDVEFLRFEFGIPGLNANRIGPEEEISILQKNMGR